jgi:hypothetical protein
MACSDTFLLAFQTNLNESDLNLKTNGHIFIRFLGGKNIFFLISDLGFARGVLDKTGTLKLVLITNLMHNSFIL